MTNDDTNITESTGTEFTDPDRIGEPNDPRTNQVDGRQEWTGLVDRCQLPAERNGDDGLEQDFRPHIERVDVDLVASGRLLDDRAWVRGFIERIVEELGLTIYQTVVHCFQPVGITAVGIIGESHVSVHTWPERGYAHVEILSCDRLPDERAIGEAIETDDVRVLAVSDDG